MTKSKLIAIVGPTGSGKTELGVFLAKRFGGEVVIADSRQIYKYLDIGTAKVTPEEMQEVPHHLLDIARPNDVVSVAEYKKYAQEAIADIQSREKLPLLVGGTGYYIDAVLYDMDFPAVPPNPKLREKLEKKTEEELFAELKEKDPDRAGSVDPKNKRRLIRALEIVESLEKVPQVQRESPYNALLLGIAVEDWDALKNHLRSRLERRIKQGMVDEVRDLHEKYDVSWERLDSLGLEYRWIARFLKGEIDKETMEDELWRAICRYAKRQMTWFKRNKDIHWIRNKKEAEKLVTQFLAP